jgi:phosphatidylglycerophosphate synthase
VSARVRDAVIVTDAGDASRTVAGVPLVLRTILVLQRAGIERVAVTGPVAPPADARVRVAVGREPPPPDAPCVVVGAGSVIDEALVRRLVADGGPVTYAVDGARAAVAAAGRVAAAVPPPAGTLVPASAPPAAVVRALLRGLVNARDGYLDRLLHRRGSRVLTPLLLRTGLTPNQVTVAGVAIGVAGGLLMGAASPAWLAAGVAALVLSGVLDCVDGEIARITFAESPFGHALDVTGDTVVHVALLAGIARRLARVAAWPGAGTLGLLLVGVIAAFAAITWSDATEDRRRRVDCWENRVLDGVLSPMTTRDWYVFPVAFALAGRLDALVPAAAWGAQAFWVVVVVLVWRVLGRSSP